MSIGDKIALISLIFTVITTACVIFLSFTALVQTARPKIKVRLLPPARGQWLIATDERFVFRVVNAGHWYGSPIAVDVTVYCNFPESFSLREMRFGSTQQLSDTRVKIGKDEMHYFKAEGIKLSHHEGGEDIWVRATTPIKPGTYRIRVTAYSANDASFSRAFKITFSPPSPERPKGSPNSQ